MQNMQCTALLKDIKGKFIEKGLVSLPKDTIALDFASDFVPLFKMDTSLKIVPLVNNQPLKSIQGDVYLSTPSFLRLTGMPASALSELKALFKSNIDLQTEACNYTSGPLPFIAKKTEKINIQIYYLNTEQMKFFSPDPLDVGQKLLIQTEEPLLLKRLIVQIDQILCLNDKGLNYICSYVNLPVETKESIIEYLENL
jgi:hypothetical protein